MGTQKKLSGQGGSGDNRAGSLAAIPGKRGISYEEIGSCSRPRSLGDVVRCGRLDGGNPRSHCAGLATMEEYLASAGDLKMFEGGGKEV